MNKPIFNILTVLMPIIIVVIITCIMDYSCYLWLHRVHHNEEIQGCVFSDIPLRATLISTHLFLVGIVVYSVLSSQNILPPEKYLVALIGSQLEKILWNPLVAIFTFKINDATRQKMLRKKGNVNKKLKYRMHWKEERNYDNLSKIFKYLS